MAVECGGGVLSWDERSCGEFASEPEQTPCHAGLDTGPRETDGEWNNDLD